MNRWESQVQWLGTIFIFVFYFLWRWRRSCPKLVEREISSSRRQRTFSFWDHHNAKEEYSLWICQNWNHSSLSELMNSIIDSNNPPVLGQSDCATDMVCALHATPYLDSACRIFFGSCLLYLIPSTASVDPSVFELETATFQVLQETWSTEILLAP